MGSFNSEKIVSQGTEKDFFTLIYNYIMSMDDSITCSIYKWDTTTNAYITVDDADADDIYFQGEKTTKIDFIFDENVKLRFQSCPNRAMGSLASVSKGYNVFFMINDTIISQRGIVDGNTAESNSCFKFSADALNGWGDATRTNFVGKYVSDDILILWLAEYNDQSYKNAKLSIMKFKDTNNNIKWASYTGPQVLESGIIKSDDGTSQYTKSSMFNYEARTGYLDFISHSSFLSGDTKAFSSSDIYDCTTVTLGDTLSLKDGANFLAIGSHSMVPLNDE